jgi:hypothetical protein
MAGIGEWILSSAKDAVSQVRHPDFSAVDQEVDKANDRDFDGKNYQMMGSHTK